MLCICRQWLGAVRPGSSFSAQHLPRANTAQPIPAFFALQACQHLPLAVLLRLMRLCMPVPAVLATVACPVFPARLQVVDEATASKDVFIKLGTPSAATHVLTVQPGEVVEIVIQNDRAGLFGGEYASNSTLTSARNGREQHSFHLHGYHFWQVGPQGCHVSDKIRVVARNTSVVAG